ncbi:hypothetical protein O181_041589 [Austropuccinia psidii MF-1]|uniref:Uncharacterized protein n=1 Tax=Austropuccinia psidii MF-1 TaxID=1389203 RepID=A0A9Q3DEG6_9BASI|nr:hypothetical protein [Austropuccinia psidii MF-1]
MFRLLEAQKEEPKPALQWLQTIQEPTDQWPSITILHNPRKFPGEDKDTRAKNNHLQPKEERFRPNNPEAVGLGERITQEPEVVVHNSRISSPINRNNTLTDIEHNVFKPDSNLNIDALWLQMSQYAKHTQKQFSELKGSHERIKKLTASMDKVIKSFQEGHASLSKASEETNKRLNLVFEEQHHSKRERDCLAQHINKLFNVSHNMKPNHKAMLWIIHITKRKLNQMPCC